MGTQEHLKGKQVISVVDWARGDSGKAKATQYFAQFCDVVGRFGGGPNTGATYVINGIQHVAHLIPVAGKKRIIGGQVWFNPEVFREELKDLNDHGLLEGTELMVDNLLSVIFPYHIAEDKIANSIGTTNRGIGPVSKDSVGRYDDVALQTLFDKGELEAKLADILDVRQATLDAMMRKKGIDKKQFMKANFLQFVDTQGNFHPGKIVERWCGFGEDVKPFVTDTDKFLIERYLAGDRILLEGSQGLLLDQRWGTRPYVTSSSVAPNGLVYTSGLPQADLTVCLIKGIPSSVGDAVLPTQIKGEEADRKREAGNEYGATTGRPRNLYENNLAELRYARNKTPKSRVLVLCKVDTLKSETVTVFDGYHETSTSGQDYRPVITDFSRDPKVLARYEGARPTRIGPLEDATMYKTRDSLEGTKIEELADFFAENLQIPVTLIGNGRDMNDFIEL